MMPASSASSEPTGSSYFEHIPPAKPNGRIPVTPAVLRSIFASSRSSMEERAISRIAFFRFAGFIISCIGIGLAASRGKGIKALGVV